MTQVLATVFWVGVLNAGVFGSPVAPTNASLHEGEQSMQASGTFEVELTPQEDSAAPAGRMLMSKRYEGGMKGFAIGQMISKRTEKGASVYYAIEEFTGEVEGNTGGFTLVHSGYMDKDGQRLEVTILDGSGSGELAGISGSMTILIDDSGHSYELSYSF